MKFIKENSYDIVKLFINQIGITIFSLVLYTAVGFISETSLSGQVTLSLSIFSTLFYFILLYTAAWDYGARDKIRVDSGKLQRVRFKGGIMSLLANAPNFILSFLTVLLMLIYMIGGGDGAYSAFGVFNLLTRFLNAMYLGILQGIFSFLENNVDAYYLWQSVGYFFAPLLAVLVTQLGYAMGERELRIISLFSSNKSNSNKK